MDLSFRKKTGSADPGNETGRPGDGGTFDTELADFLTSHHNPEQEYIIRLFRVRKIAGLAEKASYLQTWRGSVPEYDEIASVYGPGRYRCNIIYVTNERTRKYTTRYLDIDPDWGGGRGEIESGRPKPGAEIFQGNQAPGQNQSLEMFKIMAQLLNSGMKHQGAGGAIDLSGVTKAMSGIILDSARSQMELVNEVTRSRLPAPMQSQDTDESDTPFILEAIQWLRAAWTKYGPAIIGNPRAGAAMLKGQAQQLQQVQYAIDHPDEYQKLYDKFIAESGAPADRLDEFIHGLGYPTPADLMTQEQTGDTEQAE